MGLFGGSGGSSSSSVSFAPNMQFNPNLILNSPNSSPSNTSTPTATLSTSQTQMPMETNTLTPLNPASGNPLSDLFSGIASRVMPSGTPNGLTTAGQQQTTPEEAGMFGSLNTGTLLIMGAAGLVLALLFGKK